MRFMISPYFTVLWNCWEYYTNHDYLTPFSGSYASLLEKIQPEDVCYRFRSDLLKS